MPGRPPVVDDNRIINGTSHVCNVTTRLACPFRALWAAEVRRGELGTVRRCDSTQFAAD
jgi:hypothetical protein